MRHSWADVLVEGLVGHEEWLQIAPAGVQPYLVAQDVLVEALLEERAVAEGRPMGSPADSSTNGSRRSAAPEGPANSEPTPLAAVAARAPAATPAARACGN